MSEIPHNDFQAGFIAGWQTIKGTSASIPSIPSQPSTPSNRTPFLVGIRVGMKRAGVIL